jgi:hypothetical protein
LKNEKALNTPFGLSLLLTLSHNPFFSSKIFEFFKQEINGVYLKNNNDNDISKVWSELPLTQLKNKYNFLRQKKSHIYSPLLYKSYNQTSLNYLVYYMNVDLYNLSNSSYITQGLIKIKHSLTSKKDVHISESLNLHPNFLHSIIQLSTRLSIWESIIHPFVDLFCQFFFLFMAKLCNFIKINVR